MNTKHPLFKLPVPSTSFADDPHVCANVLRYQFYREGVLFRSGLRFITVPATRTRAERCCGVWHIEAYDTLIEIVDSPWVAEIRADTQELWRERWKMHHYMIYLDSAGCFEFIAESWEVLPEEPGAWEKR